MRQRDRELSRGGLLLVVCNNVRGAVKGSELVGGAHLCGVLRATQIRCPPGVLGQGPLTLPGFGGTASFASLTFNKLTNLNSP
jgi:hypothetical protein